MVAASCGGGSVAATSSTTTATTTTPIPATTTSTAPASTTTTASPEPPSAAVSIPVGPGGIEYAGGGDDLEITGPSLLAVDPSGGIHIVDPVALRVLSFATARRTRFPLASLDILAVTAISAGADHLLIVEVTFGPVRQRVHRVGFDGRLLETIDLPTGLRLEDGLSGVLSGPDGQIIIELAGGAHYGVWNAATRAFDAFDSLAIAQTTIIAEAPDLEINGVRIPADLTGVIGGMRYLGTADDGTVVVVREDVLETSPTFRVLGTVEWYTPEGLFLGSARIPPLEEQHISQPPGVALASDGRVLALVAHQRVVEVIELARQPDRITQISQSM